MKINHYNIIKIIMSHRTHYQVYSQLQICNLSYVTGTIECMHHDQEKISYTGYTIMI